MSVMDESRIVLAWDDTLGQTGLLELGVPHGPDIRAQINEAGVLNGAFYWSTDGVPTLPRYAGDAPTNFVLPEPGMTRFGILEFAPNSAGTLGPHSAGGGGPEFHRTDTINYEIVISGRIDIKFSDGLGTTLRHGDAIVLGGSAHAWTNRYPEPCRIATVMVGATRHPEPDRVVER
jgi:hypothetical protein